MDASVNRKENKEYAQSAALTVLIWLVFTAALFFIPSTQIKPQEKEYTEIRISLAPERIELPQAPVVQSQTESETTAATQPDPIAASTASAAAPAAEEPAKPTVREPAKTTPIKPAPVPAKTEPVKTVPVSPPPAAKSVPAPAPIESTPVPQTLAPDLSTLDFAAPRQNTQVTPKKTEWPDEDQFTVQTSKTDPTAQTSAVSPPVSQFEGSTGAVARQPDAPVAASSAARQGTGSASAATGESLKRIVSETFSKSGGEPGISYETTVQMAADKTSGVSIQLRDGSSRRLLDPSEPQIFLSAAAEQQIDASKRVMISFRILAGGSVPLSEISLSPAALLPVEVQREIREQIARWRFESASGDGQAIFQYSIKKE